MKKDEVDWYDLMDEDKFITLMEYDNFWLNISFTIFYMVRLMISYDKQGYFCPLA